MHRFEKAQLEAFRAAVVDPRAGKALAKAIKEMRDAGPYTIGGATRKSVPRGFDPAHERAEYLLNEGLFAGFETEDTAIAETPGFVDFCIGHFKAMWPISRWLLKEVTADELSGLDRRVVL